MSNGQSADEHGGVSSQQPDPSTDESSQFYGALKCYFFTPKRGDVRGAFCFLFNGSTGDALDEVFWVTRALTGPNIDVNTGWREFNKSIPLMGTYEKAMGDKLSGALLEIFSSSVRMELGREEDASDCLSRIVVDLRGSFERTTRYFLEFRTAFERLTRQDLVDAGLLPGESTREQSPSEPKVMEEKSFSGTLITCMPVIDPVHGVPVSELRPDDRVEVKLQGGVGAGDLIYKYLSSTSQDAIFPVESIERKDDEKTYVFLKISDEVKGLITVTKDLRLRVLRSRPLGATISINMDNLIFAGVLLVAAVVIALVVRMFFL